MELSERMKTLRKENNLKQEDVAEKLGISLRSYCRYEYGEREPGASLLIRMVEFYQVSADYLLGLSDEK